MTRRRSRGTALGVALLLLLGLALLALAGSAAAVAALALASLDQQHALAFEAAEAGIARALRRIANGATSPQAPTQMTTWPALGEQVTTRVEVLVEPADDSGWTAGFSIGLGDDAFATRHLTIVSDGRAGRGAAVRLEQGVTIVAREGSP